MKTQKIGIENIGDQIPFQFAFFSKIETTFSFCAKLKSALHTTNL